MDELKVMVATTALRDMLKKGYVSICTIDVINKITGNIPASDDYNLLHALHCVHFSEMPADLLKGMPVLLNRVLGTEGRQFEFDYEEFSKQLKLTI